MGPQKENMVVVKFVSLIAFLFLYLFLFKPSSVYATTTLEVGSGQTYTTIQAAIDAIPSTLTDAYVINIHAGTYTSTSDPIANIASKTTSTSNTITLQANGTDAVILDGESTRKAIQANVHNVIIKGLQIKNATDHGILLGTTSCNNDQILNNYFYSTSITAHFRALTIIECSNVTVKNNTIYGYSVNGIWNGGSDNTVIDGNTLYNNNQDGIIINTFSTTSDSVILKNNIISDCYSSCGSFYAIKIASGSTATLSSNDTYNYAGGNISGSYTDGGGNLSVDPTYLSTTSTAVNFLFIDSTSSLYTAGVGGIPMGGRYVATPTSLKQFKANNSPLQIVTGDSTDETAILFKGDLSTSMYTATLNSEIEIKPISEAFDGTTLTVTDGSSYAGTAVTNNRQVHCLNKNSYHWRMRAKNADGVASGWTSFGGNSENNPPTTNSATDFSVKSDCASSSDPNFSIKQDYKLRYNLDLTSNKNLQNNNFIIEGDDNSKTLLMVNKQNVPFDTLAIVKKIKLDNLLSGNNPDQIKYQYPTSFNFLPIGDFWDFRLYAAYSGAGFTRFGGKVTVQIPYDKDKLNQVIKQNNNTYSTKNLKLLALDKLKNKWVVLPYPALNLDQSTIAHVVDDLSVYVVALVPFSSANQQSTKQEPAIVPNPIPIPISTPTSQPAVGTKKTPSKKCFLFFCF